MIFTTLERIPSQFVAISVCAVAAWVFLRLQNKQLRSTLTPMIGEVLVAYFITARFSGLLVYPTEVIHLNVWTVLAQAPDYGWLFGLLASALLLYKRLHKVVAADQSVLHGLTNTILFATGVWLIVRLFVDHAEYLQRDIIVLSIMCLLLILSLQNYNDVRAWIHWLWIVVAVTWLITTTLTPPLERLAGLTANEWLGVGILLAGLGREAMSDIKKRSGHQREM
ncbi:hypothetical protein [Alicyclobacillus sp. ALC3]|uniref:hypothetical protein n=1 Tax=Alicyclobacillus sp. ALC3 TaxID=2796143 RepID=UPI0023797656|nr:hypothetical protein [Alicyclobacillus sp. ALC3]WDL95365.1 hypothetical protein JC200_13180 [Alicyclobacillus sp. ALC3]